jgi:hypothetical protein
MVPCFFGRVAKRNSHFSGLVTGSMMGTIAVADAVVFRYGGSLVVDGEITVKEMMT